MEQHAFTEKDAEFFLSHFAERKVRKRQFLIQPGFVEKYINFVVKGTFKGYVINKEGNEQTILLATDGWWITDLYSYIHKTPATMFVEAIEDSIVLQLNPENEHILRTHSTQFANFFINTMQGGLAATQHRITDGFMLTAEERYKKFAVKYPEFLQRVPQYTVASYLGITTQYLSRIKSKLLKC
ncbi:MAG: Crp/Fnr family transcriptional regulator [Cyclobacteriaceae bacterium]|nr:Crp/Fnr family transcriptional regulator [Cyclobacteriaceae bacterium]